MTGGLPRPGSRANCAADTERGMDASTQHGGSRCSSCSTMRPGGRQRSASRYLEGACADDPGLIPEVLSLLEADEAGHVLLDRDLAAVARDVLDDGVPAALRTMRFGPYRIIDVLGEGGMGVVYRAMRDDLGSVAALKILRDAWLSPARRERFAIEQRTLAQLNHPSIAHLYDANSLPDGTPWFVMEYVEGAPLTGLLPGPQLLAGRAHAPVPRRLRGGAARPYPRDHSPRPEAVEHPREGGWVGEAARLRDRQAPRDARFACRPDPHRPAPHDARPTPRPNRSAGIASGFIPTSTRSASSSTSC